MKLVSLRLMVVFTAVVLVPAVWAEAIVTSDVDDREYRYFELDNGLKALVINDPSADKAAAAMDVYIGSADNPIARPGLAHFLEHMLFLGTKKYPEPDEYQAFISANGGSHNAYTATEHTNYFFDVRADALAPALDRFAQFFVAPLFTPEYVSRERNAVNSEYSARIKDDMRRSLDALREVVNPKNPAAQFAVGSTATLADKENDPVREDLIKFYQDHYSSNNMALVVLGRESLDELETMVRNQFAAVPKHELMQPRPAEPLFSDGDLPKMLSVVPVQELRSLMLFFPVPQLLPHYREKPMEFISNLVGHEGPGSIVDILKQKGWAEGLGAGTGFDDRYTSSMLVNIQLTKAGWENRDQVIGLFFAGIEQLRKQGVKAWRYKEQKQLAELDFRYQEKQDPQRTVSYLAEQLQEYPAAEVYRAAYLFQKFDKKLIKDYLSYITPNNLFLMATAPEVEPDKVSEFYETPYKVESLKEKTWPQADDLVAQLQLPERNPFIPDNLKLLASSAAQALPQKLTLDETETWYKTDTAFGVPRGAVLVRTLLPAAGQDLTQATKLSLYQRMVEESLNSFAYPATLAGLNFSISANTRGLDFQVSGYSDKQQELLAKLFDRLTDYDTLAPEFERVKTQLDRDWRNADKRPPYAQLFSDLSVIMFSPQWSTEDKLASLKGITVEDMKPFIESLYQGGDARVLVYGNFSEPDARHFAQAVDKLLTANSQWQMPDAKVLKLDTQPDWWWLTVDHPDQALVGYLQGENDSLKEQAYVLLLQQVLNSDFFNELRTEQQLGYIVFATNVTYKQVPAMALIVQSPQASVVEIQHSMETFLRDFKLDSEDLLNQHKAALLVELQQAPKNLNEQAELYWDNILQERWTFDRREAMVKEISAITLADFNQFYQKVVIKQPRWLWLAAGEAEDKPKAEPWITNLDKFKTQSPVYTYE